MRLRWRSHVTGGDVDVHQVEPYSSIHALYFSMSSCKLKTTRKVVKHASIRWHAWLYGRLDKSKSTQIAQCGCGTGEHGAEYRLLTCPTDFCTRDNASSRSSMVVG